MDARTWFLYYDLGGFIELVFIVSLQISLEILNDQTTSHRRNGSSTVVKERSIKRNGIAKINVVIDDHTVRLHLSVIMYAL